MGVTTGIATYLIIWWVVLFAVLPLGTISHAEAGIDKGDGGDPGAPVDPKLKRKFKEIQRKRKVRARRYSGHRAAKGGHRFSAGRVGARGALRRPEARPPRAVLHVHGAAR